MAENAAFAMPERLRLTVTVDVAGDAALVRALMGLPSSPALKDSILALNMVAGGDSAQLVEVTRKAGMGGSSASFTYSHVGEDGVF